MTSKRLFDHPSDMEPLLPADPEGALTALGFPGQAAGYYFPNLYPAGAE